MSKRQPKTSYWQEAPMRRAQIVLFATSLEARIPSDHPVRLLDEILDQLDWNEWEGVYDGKRGQPPIHPSVLAKVLLFAMTRRIRSSRRIEYNLQHSIDFIWLASGRTIDHSTISEFRRGHQEQLKDIYRQMVQLAINLGVAKLAELCIDGTRVLADANRYKTWTAERLRKAMQELDGEIAKALEEMESADEIDDLFDNGQSADRLPASLSDLQTRRDQLEEAKRKLDELEAARTASGTDPKKNPAQIPKTDTDARILPNKEGGYAANYTPMAVRETENGFIVGADVLIGNVEHACTMALIDGIVADYPLEHDAAESGSEPGGECPVKTLMGDTAYSSGDNLTAAEERGIELLAPLGEPKCENNPALRDDLTEPVAEEDRARLPRNPQTKQYDKSAFVYVEEEDCYYCPEGKRLPRSGEEKKTRGGLTVIQSNYTCYDCAGCSQGADCRKNPEAKKGRKVTRDEHQGARRRHRSGMREPSSQERYKVRQHIGETPFAVIKTVFDFRRFLLRGHRGVQTEWLWACTGFNLKKLMSLLAGMRALDRESAAGVISWKGRGSCATARTTRYRPSVIAIPLRAQSGGVPAGKISGVLATS